MQTRGTSPPTRGNRILIVDPSPNVESLLRRELTSAGFDLSVCEDPSRAVASAADILPDAAIVEIRNASDGFAVLDDLRADHRASQMPVLVVAMRKDIARKARTSYNVAKSVTWPFDPDSLVEYVAETMGNPPLHEEIPPPSSHDGIVGLAEHTLAHHSRAALDRWVTVLQEEDPWRDRADLDYEQIVDVMPVVVEGIVAALHYHSPSNYFRDHPGASRKLRKHGEVRRKEGLPLTALVREYGILRDEIWATLWSKLPRTLSTPDVVNLQRVINGSTDYATELAVAAYLGEPAPRFPKGQEAILAEAAASAEDRDQAQGGTTRRTRPTRRG